MPAMSMPMESSKKRSMNDMILPQQIAARFSSKADFTKYLEVS